MATQVGQALEEVEPLDDHVHERARARDHDERNALVLNLSAQARGSVLAFVLVRSTAEGLEPDNMPAAVFGLAGRSIAAADQAGRAILALLRWFVQAGLVQELTQYFARAAMKIDVGHVNTPRDPAGNFQRVAW